MKNLLTGKTVSLIASGLILSSTMAFGADTIDSAFKEGKVSGSLALYGQKVDGKGLLIDGQGDSGFGNGNATVGFETGSFYGLNAKAEFKGNLDLGEVEDGDRENGAPFENNSLMTEAYIKYAKEGFALTAGRQAVDLEWLGDYHEAVVAAITAIPDTTVVLGYTQRKAESGIDLSEDFHEFNGNKGAYVIDVKYAGLEGIEFNPYAYSAPDVADWYGLKTTFTADMFGAVAHYAISSEDTQDDEFRYYPDIFKSKKFLAIKQNLIDYSFGSKYIYYLHSNSLSNIISSEIELQEHKLDNTYDFSSIVIKYSKTLEQEIYLFIKTLFKFLIDKNSKIQNTPYIIQGRDYIVQNIFNHKPNLGMYKFPDFRKSTTNTHNKL